MTDDVTTIVSGIGPKVRRLRKEAGLSLAAAGRDQPGVGSGDPQDRAERDDADHHHLAQGRGCARSPDQLLRRRGRGVRRPDGLHALGGAEARSSPPTSASTWRASRVRTAVSCLREPEQRSSPAPAAATRSLEHPGEELIYVLDGALEFEVNGRTFVLNTGDALHFRTVQPHSWRNPGKVDAVALWMALRPQ